MLSISQKESILRKKGVPIPLFPVRRAFRGLHLDEIQASYEREKQEVDLEVEIAVARWQAAVELLYETNIRRPVETAIQMVKSKGQSEFASQGGLGGAWPEARS